MKWPYKICLMYLLLGFRCVHILCRPYVRRASVFRKNGRQHLYLLQENSETMKRITGKFRWILPCRCALNVSIIQQNIETNGSYAWMCRLRGCGRNGDYPPPHLFKILEIYDMFSLHIIAKFFWTGEIPPVGWGFGAMMRTSWLSIGLSRRNQPFMMWVQWCQGVL